MILSGASFACSKRLTLREWHGNSTGKKVASSDSCGCPGRSVARGGIRRLAHWNGKYVLDQDEIPWKASDEELESLTTVTDRVVVLSDGKYLVSDEITLYKDTDGSTYALERDIETLLV